MAENATEIIEICKDLTALLERLDAACKRFNPPCEITIDIGQADEISPLEILGLDGMMEEKKKSPIDFGGGLKDELGNRAATEFMQRRVKEERKK